MVDVETGIDQKPNNVPDVPKQASGTTPRSYLLQYALAAIVIVAILSVAYYFLLQPKAPSNSSISITPTTSIIPTTSITSNAIVSFLSRFLIPTSLPPALPLPNSFSVSACNSTVYYNSYIEPNSFATPSSPVNYSKLNQSMPFTIYTEVEFVNSSSMNSFLSAFNSNGGFCDPYMKPISENSTFYHEPVNISGLPGYIMIFSNFTNAGLNLSSNYYMGPRPDLVWYIIVVIYKNTALTTNIWTFRGALNTTAALNYEKDIISNFTSTFK